MINNVRQFVDEINQTWHYLNQIKTSFKTLYQYNDVRLTYFNKLSGLLIAYYLAHSGKIFLHYMHPVAHHIEYHQEDIEHIKNYISSLNLLNNKSIASHTNYDQFLVINLLIGPWIAFESSIDILYNSELVSGEARQKKELEKFYSVLKILKSQNINLNFSTQDRLKRRLSDPFISAVQKWNTIFKIIKSNYQRDIKKDKVFLEFYQNCRNGMHNNFRASSDKEFDTTIGYFIFKKDQYPEFLTPYMVLKMLKELMDVSEAIFSSTDATITIEDPHF